MLRTRLHQEYGGAYGTHCAACAPQERGNREPHLTACDQSLREAVRKQREARGDGTALDLNDANVVKDEKRLCPACLLFGNGLLAGRILVQDALPRSPEAFLSRLKRLDFVSLDRWSGKPKDTAKFNARVFFPNSQDDPAGDLEFRLALEWNRVERWPWFALGLLLRDLALGRLHFGHGWSKGFGQMRLLADRITLRGPAAHELLRDPASTPWPGCAERFAEEPPESDRTWFLNEGLWIGELFRSGQEEWRVRVEPDRLPSRTQEVRHG
jgi:hypothetical protein